MYRAFLVYLRKAWHAHALFWGRNETQQSSTRSCIVLAPHPDDESIGMGATIARKTAQGTPVILVVATDGRFSQDASVIETEKLIELRKQELRRAANILGIADKDIFFIDEMDTKINDGRLRQKFEKIIDSAEVPIEEIMSTSWNDGHQDHQACAQIAHDVAVARGLVFRGCPIYWWAEGPTRFHRGHYSVTKRQLGKLLDLKRAFFTRGYTVDAGDYALTRAKAIQTYESQISQLNGDEKWASLRPEWLATFNRRREFFVKQ